MDSPSGRYAQHRFPVQDGMDLIKDILDVNRLDGQDDQIGAFRDLDTVPCTDDPRNIFLQFAYPS